MQGEKQESFHKKEELHLKPIGLRTKTFPKDCCCLGNLGSKKGEPCSHKIPL